LSQKEFIVSFEYRFAFLRGQDPLACVEENMKFQEEMGSSLDIDRSTIAVMSDCLPKYNLGTPRIAAFQFRG
jgi:hypothetical protein